MARRHLPWIAGLAVLCLIGAGVLIHRNTIPDYVKVIPEVRGPDGRTEIAPPTLVRIEDYAAGSPHRLAVLVTDETSGWLGLARGLKAHGVPFVMTRDPAVAMRHRAVLVYPILSGQALPADAIRGLADHIRGGGGVLTFNLAGGGLEELFGVGVGLESRDHQSLTWTTPLPDPRETTIAISADVEGRMGVVEHPTTTAEVLGRFGDGSVAVACRRVNGRACVMGVDLGALAQRGMNGRGEGIARTYVNGYEPSMDVLFRWVRDFYVDVEPMPWLIQTTPGDAEVSILLSHDVDFTQSVRNSAAYVEMLKSRGVEATFFVQTKYVTDYNDDAFFTAENLPALKALASSGMDIASHSVSHSAVFDTFETGSGRETYPRYRPFVETLRTARDGSVLGELRVSRFLLEDQLGAKVAAFRPGHLSYPFDLPQALQATGYAYSSSITANSTLTHLPYQLAFGRENQALTPVYEFPVTIEDEAVPPLGQRLEASNAVVEAIARNGGVVVVMIHPNVTGEKLAFERDLIDTWKDRAWIGSVSDFGAWWAGRDALVTDVVPAQGGWALAASSAGPMRPVTIILPKAGDRRVAVSFDRAGRSTTAIGATSPAD